MANDTPMVLSAEEIVMLIDNLAVQPYDETNFHFFYEEYLNDSTWVILILQNQRPGSERFGICNVLEYGKSHVFIYGDQYCNNGLAPGLKSDGDWPFEWDGINFKLLVEKRKGLIDFYTMKKHFSFDQGDIDTTGFRWWD
jgi:hypothetical protein